MKKLFLTLCFTAVALLATAADPFNDNIPDRYTVKRGDTLWDISESYLRDPWLWPEIWYANPQIANPHLIYPGDVIKLIYIDGQPRLTVQRHVKLSPEIREEDHDAAIPSIPLEVITNFLSRNRVVDEDAFEMAPYVLAGAKKKLLTGVGDDLYARGDFSEGIPVYGIYRRGDPYIDPETDKVLGLRAEDIGTGKIKAIESDIATLGATRSVKEIRVKDRLLPHEQRRIEPTFFPSAPEQDVEGVIIAVEGGVSQVGPLDVVAINRGEREGLAEGNVLAIYRLGEIITDRVVGKKVKLPDERAGLLMVFRTFEKMSFGLVLQADRPLSITDIVKNP